MADEIGFARIIPDDNSNVPGIFNPAHHVDWALQDERNDQRDNERLKNQIGKKKDINISKQDNYH